MISNEGPQQIANDSGEDPRVVYAEQCGTSRQGSRCFRCCAIAATASIRVGAPGGKEASRQPEIGLEDMLTRFRGESLALHPWPSFDLRNAI
jgi:hypothetical protein